MLRRIFLLLACLSLMSLSPASQASLAAPQLAYTALNAGCYRVTPSVCQLHVDPFELQLSSGTKLLAFQLRANGHVVYDFHTDASNPPATQYFPSPVAKGFAATCGQTYTIELFGQGSGDPGLTLDGRAEDIVCPTGTYLAMLPVVQRNSSP